MKNVYLSSNNNSFFCLLVLEWKDEAPVEIAFPGEGPVMHICLLLVLFHSLKPTFDKDVTAFLSCQDVGFLKKDILRVPDNHSQLITNNNTNVAPLFEVRNTVFLLWMTVWSQVKNSQKLNYIKASRDIWGETTECCPYVVGFLGVMSTGAPGEGMSIGNMSTHISILP